MILYFLFTALFVQTSPQSQVTSVPQAQFEVKRFALRLITERQLVVRDGEVPAEVVLEYEGILNDPSIQLEADLTGPGLSAPLAIAVAAQELAIRVSPGTFPSEGSYFLGHIRLTRNGELVALAEPSRAEIQVVDTLVISRVEVAQLSREELAARGYLFNPADYRSVEMKLALVMGGKTVDVEIPVILPIKKALGFRPIVIQNPHKPFVQVLSLKSRPSNVTVNGFGVKKEAPPLVSEGYQVYSLLLIPGQINYLHTHFSARIVVINAAPDGFDVRVEQLKAKMKLPDPTRYGFPVKISDQNPNRDLIHLGLDGLAGSEDDRTYIYPAEEASAEYILTGEYPGLYEIELEIEGEAQLPQGIERIDSSARGVVFVRSPEFSVDFEHPETVAEGEPYEFTMHFTNTGAVPLEGLSVTLDPGLLISTELNGGNAVQTLPDLAAGEEGSLVFAMRSLVTGQVAASYHKIDDGHDSNLILTIGVGQTGEQLSPYIISFPPEFEAVFPQTLTMPLRRYAKKLFDFAQTRQADLPSGLVPISSAAARQFNKDLVSAARANLFGADYRESLITLFSSWMRSVKEYEPMDRLRRRVLGEPGLEFESYFGSELGQACAGLSSTQILELISRENEDTPGLFAAIVENGDGSDLIVRDDAGREMRAGGARDIAFSGIFPIDSERTLVWVANAAQPPSLNLETVGGSPADPRVIAFFSLLPDSPGGRRILADSGTVKAHPELAFIFDIDREAMAMHRGTRWEAFPGSTLEPKLFTLNQIRHLDPTLAREADDFGRDLLIAFSKPLDLSSLDPVEDHILINGKPAVDAQLQTDSRFLIVSARMPLGPYKPIAYQIDGARSVDGQALGRLSGSIQGSSFYTGVTVAGRVVDRNGADLEKARVLLWQLVTIDSKPSWVILDITTPDRDGRYAFDYARFLPFQTSLDPRFNALGIGVLLDDGRYEYRLFAPQGPGQELRADFAFNQLAEVWGEVRDDEGNPAADVTVYVANQRHPDSAAVVRTDDAGVYRATGIEVGPVVANCAFNGVLGINGGYLTQYNSPLRVDLFLDQHYGALGGHIEVEEGETATPLAGAIVGFIHNGGQVNQAEVFGVRLNYSVLGFSDENGDFALENAPAGNGIAFVYHPNHGRLEQQIVLAEAETAQVDFTFRDWRSSGGRVSGFVRDAQGTPVANAWIGTGPFQGVSGFDGRFSFEDLPLNVAIAISAESGNLKGRLNVFLDEENPELDNLILTLLPPIGISGIYLDENDQPVPFALLNYFNDDAGHRHAIETRADGTWSLAVAKIGTYNFTANNPPQIAHATRYVGQSGVDDLVLQDTRNNDFNVRLLDGNGNPVVAKVLVDSLIPDQSSGFGLPVFTRSHTVYTDNDGVARFKNINTGDVSVSGYSQILGTTSTHAFTLNPRQPGEQPVTYTLAFGAEEPASLFGRVFAPDGVTPAPAGTLVQAKVNGFKAIARVDSLGWYRFESLVTTADPVRVQVLAYHPDQDIYADATIDLNDALLFRNDMVLQNKASLHVHVIHADGTPADFASVRLTYRDPSIAYVTNPEDGEIELNQVTETGQITPEQSELSFGDIPAGPFTLNAIAGNGLTGMRAYSVPGQGGDLRVTVQLEATSRITGTFVDHGDLPIADGEVQLRSNQKLLFQQLSGATLGEEGRFAFEDLPMRTYDLVGTDPATALEAHLRVITSAFQPEPDVLLKLDPIGDIEGTLTLNGVPVVNARLELSDGASFKLLTGSDALGGFRYHNLPLGEYRITASHVNTAARATGFFHLDETGQTLVQDLAFEDVLDFEIEVREGNGTPVAGVLVYAGQGGRPLAHAAVFTDAGGVAHFNHLPPGQYKVQGEHPATLERFEEEISLSPEGEEVPRWTLAFPGVATVFGRVTDTLGGLLTQAVRIRFDYEQDNAFISKTIDTDAEGNFRMGRLPVAIDLNLTAFNPVTDETAYQDVLLTAADEERQVDLAFRAATYGSGTVRFQNGDPVPYARVWVTDPVRREVRADAAGNFFIKPLLSGAGTLFAQDAQSPRSARIAIQISGESGSPQPLQGIDLTLGGIADLTGTVRLADNLPIAKGTVTLHHQELGKNFATAILADGGYYFRNLPLGTYRLQAVDANLTKTGLEATLTADMDGAIYEQDLTFEPAFVVSGRVFEANGVTPAADAVVELWRARGFSLTSHELIYRTRTNQDGFYVVDHVYPGLYRVIGSDRDLGSSYLGELLMADQDKDLYDLYLQIESQVSGIFGDADGQVLPGSRVSIHRNGKQVASEFTNSGGVFSLDNLFPGTYEVRGTALNGWVHASTTLNLVAGPNPLNLAGDETVTITGRVIYQNANGKIPSVNFAWGDKTRYAAVDASGYFHLNWVPVGRAYTMRLSRDKAWKTMTVGPFSEDTDLGTLYLDGSAPGLSFAGNGEVVTALPYDILFQVEEPDLDSHVTLAQTRVWLDTVEITQFFAVDGEEISGRLDYFPLGIERGVHQLRVLTGNNSGLKIERSYSIDIQPEGTTLLVTLNGMGPSQTGSLRLDNGEWIQLESVKSWVFNGVAEGSHVLRAKSFSLGGRRSFPVDGATLTQAVSLSLAGYGGYTGRVTDPAGQPVAEALVTIGSEYEYTDGEGDYFFDYLPLGAYEIQAEKGSRIAYREAPPLNLAEIVVLDQDLQLAGRGRVQGFVWDQGGSVPVAGAEIELSYDDFPIGFNHSAITAADGGFLLEDVIVAPFSVHAYDAPSKRSGFASAALPGEDQTVSLNIDLSPSGTVIGILSDASQVDLGGIRVRIERNGFVYGETLSLSDGSFSLASIPYGSGFTLDAEDAEAKTYYEATFNLGQAQLDLGVLNMVIDLPPLVSQFSLSNPLDPRINHGLNMSFSDDRGLLGWTLTYSGAFEFQFGSTYANHSMPPRQASLSGINRIHAGTQSGTLFYDLEVEDTLGQIASYTGSVEIVTDVVGPNLTITAPGEGESFLEGSAFTLTATASDPNGINRLELRLGGTVIATDTSSPFALSGFAVGVTQASDVAYEVVAFDKLGNETVATRTLHIVPVEGAGTEGPQLTMHYPLDGMALPLFLPSGLKIPFKARVFDPDGLERYEIRADSQLIAAGWLHGTEDDLDNLLTLPAAMRDLTQLDLELAVTDLLGNTTIGSIQVTAVDGQVWEQGQPLEIDWHDTSRDGQSHILDGGYHRIDGKRQFTNLILVNGAHLTQSATNDSSGYMASTRLTLDGDFLAAPGTIVNLDGKGFTSNPPWIDGGGWGVHGGLAYNSSATVLHRIYGSPFQPVDPGCRGGGGAISIAADRVWLCGEISADSNAANKGSGGSIWVAAATRMDGYGRLRANGFLTYNANAEVGAGGGRIAIYGAFKGAAEAYGGNGGGAGSVYHRVTNPASPDGFDDELIFANHPQATAANFSTIHTLAGVVGTDFSLTYNQSIGLESVDILNFLGSPSHPWNGFLGMRVYQPGDYAGGGRIDGQETSRLVSGTDASFPQANPGDTLNIGYRVDRLVVGHRARFHLMGQVPESPILLRDGELFNDGEPLELTAWDWEIAANLDGAFAIDHLITKPDEPLRINGAITANQVQVVAGSILEVPLGKLDGYLVIDAPQIQVDGTLRARVGDISYGNSILFNGAHGGQGSVFYSADRTYGSLYEPQTSGYPEFGSYSSLAGGRLDLSFEALTLNGVLDVSGQKGSGGSIRLRGQTLTGSGSMRADGADGYEFAFGGGRIAVLVDDISLFAGTATAYGGKAAETTSVDDAGAGTVFYRTAQWPNGKLVIDNRGAISKDGSTLLPGLGERVAAGQTGGAAIAGTDFPKLGGLAGMYALFDNDLRVRIQANSETELTADGLFPDLLTGDGYSGLHILDILHVVNNAKFKSPDPIEVLAEFDFTGGTVDAQVVDLSLQAATLNLANGSSTLQQDNGHLVYLLDNYNLTVNFPMNVDRIQLTNGSTLTYSQPVNANLLEVDDSDLIAKVAGSDIGLTAGDLSLSNGATWTIADRASNGQGYILRAAVPGLLAVDATSKIFTTGASKATNVARYWGSLEMTTAAHGGIRPLTTVSRPHSEHQVLGSYAYPTWQGTRQTGGGFIRLAAGELQLEGTIEANATTSGSGGSIWIEAPQISGAGSIAAKPSRQLSAGGGGRVAIYYGQDDGFMDTLHFYMTDTSSANHGFHINGAGTVFCKGELDNYGTLLVDQETHASTKELTALQRNRLTGITGPDRLVLSLEDDEPDPWVIRDRSWDNWAVPFGLGGLYARFESNGTVYDLKILDNTHNTLFLEPIAGPPPAALIPAGTTIEVVLKLDRLKLRHGAQLYFAGLIECPLLDLGPGGDAHANSVWCRDLVGLTSHRWENQKLRFILEEPQWQSVDLELEDSVLYLDRPIAVDTITMTRSTLSHSPIYYSGDGRLTPWLHVTADQVAMDSVSAFDVSGLCEYYYDDKYGRRSHGGLGESGDSVTYGSLFRPATTGSGTKAGGRVYLKANSVAGGHFVARGSISGYNGAGGSIWLEVGQMTGDIELNARGASYFSGGGRIAVYYDDIDGATITTEARGSKSAGTAFFKRNGETFGDFVIPNDPSSTTTGAPLTPIPVFSIPSLPSGMTAQYSAATDMTTLFLPGLSTGDGDFRDYALVFNGEIEDSHPILEHRTVAGGIDLDFSGDLSWLTSADSVKLAVKFKSISLLCGSCYLGPDESQLLILVDETLPAGYVFTDGSADLEAPPQLTDGNLILDNFQMTISAPVDFNGVDLRNGSTLTIAPSNGETSQLGTVFLDQASLLVAQAGNGSLPTLAASSIQMTGSQITADHLDISGDLELDATSSIDAYSLEPADFEWPVGNSPQAASSTNLSFGGLGARLPTLDFPPTFGSFSQPWLTGRDRRHLKISAGSLHVDGTIAVDADGAQMGGGALWISTGDLSGSGTISASAAAGSPRGGGRIAIYYSDRGNWSGTLRAYGATTGTPGDSYEGTGASGTVYLKRDDQTYGELLIHGYGESVPEGSTEMVALGQRQLSANATINGDTLSDPDQVFPYSLAGLFLAFDDGGLVREFRILDNTPTSITVEGTLPAALVAGTPIWARLHLDGLTIDGKAQFHTNDELVLHGSPVFDSNFEQAGTLWARRLILPSSLLVLEQQAGGLVVDQTHNIAEIRLDDALLSLDRPFSLDTLSLVNGSVLTHAPVLDLAHSRYTGHAGIDLDVGTLTIDATSSIDVRAKGFPSGYNDALWDLTTASTLGYAHAGNVPDMYDGYAYGSAFDPHQAGMFGGGGVVLIVADSLVLNGSIDASGLTGGSVRIDAGSVSGSGTIDASGGSSGGAMGSAGRIAIFYDTYSLMVAPVAKSPVDGTYQIGAGTVFLRDRSETLGDLYAVNDAGGNQILTTPIQGIGTHTLPEALADPRVIVQPGAGWRNGLRGMLVVDEGTGETYRVIDQTGETLTLDRPISPVPGIGWQYHGRLPIANLTEINALVEFQDEGIFNQ